MRKTGTHVIDPLRNNRRLKQRTERQTRNMQTKGKKENENSIKKTTQHTQNSKYVEGKSSKRQEV